MILSKEAVEEFKELYKKRFKEELTDEEAFERATKLVNLFEVVYGPEIRKRENEKNRDIR